MAALHHVSHQGAKPQIIPEEPVLCVGSTLPTRKAALLPPGGCQQLVGLGGSKGCKGTASCRLSRTFLGMAFDCSLGLPQVRKEAGDALWPFFFFFRQGHGGATACPCLSALSSQCRGKHGNGNVSSADKESRNAAAHCAQQLPLCAREIAGEIGNSTYKEGNGESPPNFSFNAVCWYPGPLL